MLRLKRGLTATFLAVLAIAFILLMRVVDTACTSSVEGFIALSSARDQARATSTVPIGTGQASPLVEAIRSQFIAVALTAILNVKQSDLVAFPAHAGLGWLLETKGCAPDLVADQWIKGSKHASNPFFVELAAIGLIRSSSEEILPVTIGTLNQIVRDEPWFEMNISSVRNRIRIKIAPASESRGAPQSEVALSSTL